MAEGPTITTDRTALGINDIADEFWIDKCFAKINSIYPGYSAVDREDMDKLYPDISRAIDEIYNKESMTIRDLKNYFDYNVNLWNRYKYSKNSLVDRLKILKP